MSIQQKVQLVSKNRIWSEIRHYKVNDVVSYEEDSYQNITGKNSQPDELSDWVKIGGSGSFSVTPFEQIEDYVDTNVFTVPSNAIILNVFYNGGFLNKTNYSRTGNTVTVDYTLEYGDTLTFTGITTT